MRRDRAVHFPLAEKAIQESTKQDVSLQSAPSYKRNIMALRIDTWVVDTRQPLEARRSGIIPKLYEISSKEIVDRRKDDTVVAEALVSRGTQTYYLVR